MTQLYKLVRNALNSFYQLVSGVVTVDQGMAVKPVPVVVKRQRNQR